MTPEGRFELIEVEELQSIRNIRFPADVSFRQLLVTGPPGVGKTTLVEAIGGWPEEGFLDLTARNWWRSRVLAIRPRQLHLGLPFHGYRTGRSVFDPVWDDRGGLPELDLDRILLPPLGRRDPWSLRRRYVFDFLLPPPKAVFEARSERSDRHSHQVDETLSLQRVRDQLDASWRVAEHLHRAGIPVFIRDSFGGAPKTFSDPSPTDLVDAKLRGDAREPFFRRTVKRIFSPSGYRVLDRFERIDLRDRRALVPLKLLPVELTVGQTKLLLVGDGSDVRVVDPERYFDEPAGFARLTRGNVVRLPGLSSGLGMEVAAGAPPTAEIAHEGDWLAVADLDSATGTRLQAVRDAVENRIETDREERARRLAEILAGIPPFLPVDDATRTLRSAVEVLKRGTWRPPAGDRPGSLIEIPAELTTVLVGDLHGRVDNLVDILTEGRTLDALLDGRAALVLLGDLVHPADDDLSDMTSSLELTDIVARLMARIGPRLIHLRGNHETFSHEISKAGVPQGRLWRDRVLQERGPDYLKLLRRYYDLLPYVAAGGDFVACHAGPPTSKISRRRVIGLHEDRKLRYQVTWGRVRTSRRPAGYTKRDVRALQKALGQQKPSALIVSHDPGSSDEAIVMNRGGIKRHHLVYSARSDGTGVLLAGPSGLVPLIYPPRASTVWPPTAFDDGVS